MSRPSPKEGFFERRPWLGALLFAALVVACGVTLVSILGVRPHYRETNWNLITNLAPAGTGQDGGSALCLVAEEFRHDPISVDVLVNVRDELDRPGGHLQVLLAAEGGTRLLSYGITEPRGGSLHLSVPQRFDQSLFRGELEVMVLQPGLPPIRATPPPPKRGHAALGISVPASLTVTCNLRRADGAPFTGEAFVSVHPVGQAAHELARGYRVVGGQTRIGGLPRDLDLRFDVHAAGFASGSERLRFPTAEGDPAEQDLHLGLQLARLETRLVRKDGKEVQAGDVRVSYTALPGASQTPARPPTYRSVAGHVDDKGLLTAAIVPQRGINIAWIHYQSGSDLCLSSPLTRGALLPGETWKPGDTLGELKAEPQLNLQRGDPLPWPAPRKGARALHVTVQFADGLPVGTAIVRELDRNRDARQLVPWVVTPQTGELDLASTVPWTVRIILATTETHYGWTTAREAPLFIGVKPFASARLQLQLPAGFRERWGPFIELVPKKLRAPDAVVFALQPEAVPLSTLNRCRIPRLFPGIWTVRLLTHDREQGGRGGQRILGTIEIPAPGAPVKARFRVK